jgi:hypothetical protein
MESAIVLNPTVFWTKRTTAEMFKKKEELIKLLAFYHSAASKRLKQYGVGEFEISLLSLRKLVRDYQPAFDFFFEVVKKGYRYSADDKQLTTVIPKMVSYIIDSSYNYVPPERPDGTFSKVYVLRDDTLVNDVIKTGLLHLVPKIQFLQSGPGEFNFIFKPCGDLELRDTSIWPIEGIETWPAWVRSRLFGSGVDIKSAYIQFVIENISEHYKTRSRNLFDKIFILWERPDEIRNKVAKILNIDANLHKKEIKKLLMAVAMGSKVSPTLVFNDVSFSRCSTIINKLQPGISEQQALEISNLLTPIGTQFKLAKNTVETSMNKYFIWERERRYVIWELVDRHGIMMHDGIDGIPEKYIDEICNMDLGFEISRS